METSNYWIWQRPYHIYIHIQIHGQRRRVHPVTCTHCSAVIDMLVEPMILQLISLAIWCKVDRLSTIAWTANQLVQRYHDAADSGTRGCACSHAHALPIGDHRCRRLKQDTGSGGSPIQISCLHQLSAVTGCLAISSY